MNKTSLPPFPVHRNSVDNIHNVLHITRLFGSG